MTLFRGISTALFVRLPTALFSFPRVPLFLAGLAFFLPLWFLPFSHESFLLPKTVLLGFGAAVAITLCLLEDIRSESSFPAFPWGTMEWAWAGLLAALTLSWVASPWRAAGFEAYALAASWILTGLASSRSLRSFADTRLLARSAALSATIAALWGLWQEPGSPSTIGNPGFLASYLAACGPLLIALGGFSKGNQAWIWLLGLVIIFAGVIFSGSRSGWLAMAVSWPLAFWSVFKSGGFQSFAVSNWRRLLLFVSAIALLGFAMIATSSSPTSTYVRRRFQSALDSDSSALRNRRLMWQVAWDMFRSRPLLGQGPGGYHYRHLEYQARELVKPGFEDWTRNWTYTHSAHDIWMHLLAEWGILGTGAFLALLTAAFLRWRRTRSLRPFPERALCDAWVVGALALLIDGIFGLPLQLPASGFLLAVGLSAGSMRASRPSSEGLQARWPRVLRIAAGAMAFAALCLFSLVLWKQQSSEIDIARAMGRAQKGNIRQAEAALRKAVTSSPSYGKAHFFLGNTLLLSGAPGPAIESFKAALKTLSDPNIPYDLGLAYMELGDSASARLWYAEALRLKPLFPEVFATLGYLSRREGRHAEAEAWLKRSLESAPGNLAVLRELGFLYRKTGRIPEALDCFIKVAHAYPRDTEVLHALETLRRKELPDVKKRKGP